MSDLPQSNLTNFHFSGSGEVESTLPHDFLAKLEVTLWSVLTYENCEQVGFAIVDGKQRSVISKVSFEELKQELMKMQYWTLQTHFSLTGWRWMPTTSMEPPCCRRHRPPLLLRHPAPHPPRTGRPAVARSGRRAGE